MNAKHDMAYVPTREINHSLTQVLFITALAISSLALFLVHEHISVEDSAASTKSSAIGLSSQYLTESDAEPGN